MAIQNNLAQFRQKRGLSVIKLAKEIGVSRQTIYAMETGTYVPNTLVALKLAQVLEVTVEDLFHLEAAEVPDHTEVVELLPGDQDPQPGLPVQLCDVEAGKIVVALEGGDPMIYGTTFYLEMLPKDFPSEIVPGIGAFQSVSAAVKMSPVFGYDTDSVIVTMDDFPGRKDINEKLMATQTSMIFYTMGMNYPRLFEQLNRHYPATTPVAVVSFAGERGKQQIVQSTVGRFMKDVDYKKLPNDAHTILVGKFLEVGQARIDALLGAKKQIERVHGATPTAK